MGEAKRRRENDPLFGKVPQDAMSRGIIVSVPLKVENNSLTVTSAFDPDELRFSLLFWDELVWPQNNFISFGGTPEFDFLESAGVLTKPMYNVGSGSAGEIVGRSQLRAFQERNNREPGKWSLAQGERSFQFFFEQSEAPESVLLELHKAVPIPRQDVPLAEILEFKQRRRDELLLLRTHLEQLAKEIREGSDPNGKLQQTLKEVDRACGALLTLGREWRFPMELGSLNTSVSIEPTKVVMNALKGYGAAEYFNLPIAARVIGGVAAAAGSVITIKPEGFKFRGWKAPAGPYRYAHRIHEELR